MRLKTMKTPQVRVGYEESGPKTGEPMLLVHGWPDSARAWDKVLPMFHSAGYRTVVPWLRGYGPSTFRDRLLGRSPRRTGQPVAFAQDLLALADGLGWKRFEYVGHDWGARTGYALAALAPERLRSLTVLSVPFAPGKAEPPALAQAQAFWYQWLLCTKPGEAKFREDPVAFGRAQWDAWSPKGWYTEAEFAEAAESWTGEDFKEVVLHSYRSRWGHAELDPQYARQQRRLEAMRTISVPTTLLHGVEDRCELKETTDGAEQYFSGRYRRVLVEGVGHFPHREAPEVVAGVTLAGIAYSRR